LCTHIILLSTFSINFLIDLYYCWSVIMSLIRKIIWCVHYIHMEKIVICALVAIHFLNVLLFIEHAYSYYCYVPRSTYKYLKTYCEPISSRSLNSIYLGQEHKLITILINKWVLSPYRYIWVIRSSRKNFEHKLCQWNINYISQKIYHCHI
jgi:hypothetical protein